MEDRRAGSRVSHERPVERFHTLGVNHRTEIHGGFLNFGLWNDGIQCYVAAAENLVYRIGEQLGRTPGCRVLDVARGVRITAPGSMAAPGSVAR